LPFRKSFKKTIDILEREHELEVSCRKTLKARVNFQVLNIHFPQWESKKKTHNLGVDYYWYFMFVQGLVVVWEQQWQ
jgi:hypothetical protein